MRKIPHFSNPICGPSTVWCSDHRLLITEYKAPFVCYAFSSIVHVPSFQFCWRSGTASPSRAQSRFVVGVHTGDSQIGACQNGSRRTGLYAPNLRLCTLCRLPSHRMSCSGSKSNLKLATSSEHNVHLNPFNVNPPHDSPSVHRASDSEATKSMSGKT